MAFEARTPRNGSEMAFCLVFASLHDRNWRIAVGPVQAQKAATSKEDIEVPYRTREEFI